MNQRYLYLFLLLTIFSCTKEIDISLPKGRTILVYLAGDNDLSSEVPEMQAELMEGWTPKLLVRWLFLQTV